MKVFLDIKKSASDIKKLLKGHSVETPDNSPLSLSAIAKNNYDAVFIDGDNRLMAEIKRADPRVEIVLFSNADRDYKIDIIRRGVSGYFTPPYDLAGIEKVIENIAHQVDMRSEIGKMEQLLNQKYSFEGITGKNPRILEIIDLIRRIAPFFNIVMFTGETGTGKEVFARALHRLSPVADIPFISFNCGSIVETIAESQLFGHEKGSFTGATGRQAGLFESAGKGTVFLDEIGELPLSLQPHLLRVLHSGEFSRVGSHEALKAECRIIVATNRDLNSDVAAGRFREDLLYRLTPLVIHVPPLREHRDDIPLLCRQLLEKFNERTGKNIRGISRPAQTILMSCDWRGNVRQLENAIEHAALITTGSFIHPSDLPASIRGNDNDTPAQSLGNLDHLISTHIKSVLQQCKGNRTYTSKLLGISRRSLLRKIEKYSIVIPNTHS